MKSQYDARNLVEDDGEKSEFCFLCKQETVQADYGNRKVTNITWSLEK